MINTKCTTPVGPSGLVVLTKTHQPFSHWREVIRQPIGLQGKALSNVRGECGDYNNNNIVASIFNQPLVGERLLFPDPKL